MALYTIISDVSRRITELLQEELVPELIPSGEYVGLGSPAERDNLMVGIFLYDIQESTEIKGNYMIRKGTGALGYPPVYINLYYMITIYIEGDIQFKSLREEMIIGRIIRFFNDYSVILNEQNEIPVKIEFMNVNMEEKAKLWSLINTPYKVSVFYKVYPITVDSGRIREVSRVKSVDIHVLKK